MDKIETKRRIRWNIDKVRHFVEIESGSGCKLISEEYINSRTRLIILCACNEEFSIALSNFIGNQSKRGKRECNNCSIKRRALAQRKGKEVFEDEVLRSLGKDYCVAGEYKGVSRRVKIKHIKCNGTYSAYPSNVIKGHGCPYCSGLKVLKGYNDMWTTNPELAPLLANPEDGYNYSQFSNKRVDWKCSECTKIIKNKTICDINSYGLSCPKCTDGISFPEKFIRSLLILNKIKFQYDERQKWSQGRRYDFYLPDYNWVVEVHGEQHYTNSFSYGRTLREERNNDSYKKERALRNGVTKYIIIDARISSTSYLTKSVKRSPLIEILFELDFEKAGRLSERSVVREVCELWRKGVKNTSKIANKTRLTQGTVIRYLKRGAEIGWCDYCPIISKRLSNTSSKAIIQLSLYEDCIVRWSSIQGATKEVGVAGSGISAACRGRYRTAGGFKWMYKEDYDQMVEEGLSHEEYMDKYYPRKRSA